MKVILMTLN